MLRLTEIAEGNPGIYQTVAKMRALALSPSPRADRIATMIAGQFPGGSPYMLAAAVHSFILKNFKYASDNPEVEELYSPELLFAQIENRGYAHGDCDDFAMGTASLLCRLGISCHFVVASTRVDRTFDHVYVQAVTEHGVVPMDAIFGEAFGWSAIGSFTSAEAIKVC